MAARTRPARHAKRGRLRIVDRRGRRLNRPHHPPGAYRGWIGVERQGRLSALYPKLPFAFETRTRRGANRNVALLGMPRENDWILRPSYTDPALMREPLAYATARRMGRYASRTRYVELVINESYRGVYILTEEPKLDRARVDVGRDETLLELTGPEKVDAGDAHFRLPVTGRTVRFSDPARDEVGAGERARIERLVAAFERTLYGPSFTDPAWGWRALADAASLVDLMLVNELIRNQDGFASSTFLTVRRDGRLVFGPLWDADLTMGNAIHRRYQSPDGWQLADRPWAARLYQDPSLRAAMRTRWAQLRRTAVLGFMLRRVDAYARALRGPARRNFRQWPLLQLWPERPLLGGHADEVRALKRWLTRRAAWLDRALAP